MQQALDAILVLAGILGVVNIYLQSMVMTRVEPVGIRLATPDFIASAATTCLSVLLLMLILVGRPSPIWLLAFGLAAILVMAASLLLLHRGWRLVAG